LDSCSHHVYLLRSTCPSNPRARRAEARLGVAGALGHSEAASYGRLPGILGSTPRGSRRVRAAAAAGALAASRSGWPRCGRSSRGRWVRGGWRRTRRGGSRRRVSAGRSGPRSRPTSSARSLTPSRRSAIRSVTPHEMRHSAADAVFRSTGNIVMAQMLLRHESPATTAIYLHPTRDDLAEALRGLDASWGKV
jgi:integrase